MKRNIIKTSLLCSSILLAACVHEQNQMMPFSKNANGTMSTSQLNQENADILGDLVVLNQNEIAVSKIALSKSKNTEVRNYAEMLNRDHSKNLQETLRLAHKIHISPQENRISTKLHHKGEKELAVLRHLDGKHFDSVFIRDMIKDHQGAINLLDMKIKRSTNPMLTKQLKATREGVAMHLAKAKMIQKTV